MSTDWHVIKFIASVEYKMSKLMEIKDPVKDFIVHFKTPTLQLYLQ